jgi:hypothetical protein
MRVFSALFILSFITLSSCDKWEDKEKEAYYYYSTDFKPVDLKSNAETILNINVNDIEILYTVFFQKKKVWRYKLVIENFDIENDIYKSDKVLVYEEGVANVDDDLNILFIPDSNPNSFYTGYFENDKRNFKVSLPEIYNREINFLEN